MIVDKYSLVMLSVLAGFASAQIPKWVLPVSANLDFVFLIGAIVIVISAIKMFEKKPSKIDNESLYK